MPTSDFQEVQKTARQAADERDQRIAVSDLIAAFPQQDGQLSYGQKAIADTIPAVIERIEHGLLPLVTDFMSNFEAQMREIAQRQLGAALQSFEESQLKEMSSRLAASLEESGRHLYERQLTTLDELARRLEQRQFTAFDEIGQRVRHDIELLRALLDRLDGRIQEKEGTDQPDPTPGAGTHPIAVGSPSSDGSGSFWQKYGFACRTGSARRFALRDAGRKPDYSLRSTSWRFSPEMARAGFSPFGQALVQFRIVWQRYSRNGSSS
jgi:hypothetical protein